MRALGLILVCLAMGCVLDSSTKTRCERDSDCLAGRVCVARQCAPFDASADLAIDAHSAPDVAAADTIHFDGADGIDGASAADGADAIDVSGDAVDARTDERGLDVAPDHPPLGSERPNYVFTTSKMVVPRFAPLESADVVCQAAAVDGGLPGTFRAWLSTSAVNARDRLGDARGWIRPDGAPVADTVDDLSRGRIFYPMALDEHGHWIVSTPGDGDDLVMTGTTEFGLLAPEWNCSDWAPPFANGASAGTVRGATDTWTTDEGVTCNQPARLRCFGVDQAVPVSVGPAPGRVAFLSTNRFSPSSGLSAADGICQGEAAAAGLSGRFLALLATSRVAAADRFTVAAGDLWVRPDGVVLARSGPGLFDDGPLAAVNVTADRRYLDGRDVVTGGLSPRDLPAPEQTCEDWTSGNAFGTAYAGSDILLDWWFAGRGSIACNSPAQVYCLRQD